jgi:hypothetical protein
MVTSDGNENFMTEFPGIVVSNVKEIEYVADADIVVGVKDKTGFDKPATKASDERRMKGRTLIFIRTD